MSDVAKPRLKPASENPWYCLATLYGEQRGDGIDGDLAEKNRVGWDRWVGSAGGGMTEELHTELLKKPFMARMGIRAALPDPSQPVDFTYTCFENPFVFSGFQCPREVDFSWAEFLNYADFGRAQFRQQAIFRSATFSKNANFATAIFSDVADFNSGTFLESADLSRTYFEGANFSSASFSKKVTFDFAKFFRRITFRSAGFSAIASFNSATFSDHADFSSTAFSGSVYFDSVKFLNRIDFSSTTFSSRVDFIDADFASATYFQNANFVSGVPDFRGAKLHEATEWQVSAGRANLQTRMQLKDKYMPTSGSSKKWSVLRSTRMSKHFSPSNCVRGA
jgi:uncharacterized protein YjbI with pentapeptide repeats